MIPSRRLSSQRGATVFSMVILAIIVGFLLLMGARVFPAINEYLTIRKAVASIMAKNPAGPGEIRTSFEKTSEVEYSIHTITAKDLDIQPAGDGFKTSYHYNVEVPVFEPSVYILLKFAGTASTPNANIKGP
jgi:hypothetical protein